MSMPKKVKPEIVYVKCRNCKNASDFGDNSAYCKAKGHTVLRSTGISTMMLTSTFYQEFKKHYFNEYRNAYKDT